MPKSCVFCGTTEALNTELKITLDDGAKVTVEVCDTHAEDASVKTAKAAYIDRQQKIAAVLEQARSLGLELSTAPSGLVVASSQPAPQMAQPTIIHGAQMAPAIVPAGTQDVESLLGDGPDVLPTSKVDAVRGMVSVGGSTEFGTVQSHSSYSIDGLNDKLPTEARAGKAKIGIVEGRGGQPLAIPTRRLDGTGLTRLSVINTGGDAALQRRFKDMADDSRADRGPKFSDGYDQAAAGAYGQRPCPLCHGAMEIMNAGQWITCPKCKGAGIML